MWTNNTFITTTQFLLLKYNVLHFRHRTCNNASIPFFVPPITCYDVCPTGYAIGTDYCVLCSYTCATCQIDGTSCNTCPNNANRTLNTNACPCDTGYYDTGVVACAACNSICLTCSTNATNCLSCDPTRNLTANCACKTYYFEVNAPACTACHYSCLTCSTTSTNCTSCDNSTFRLFYNATNSCPCQNQYQDNGTATCQSSPLICAAPCLTCSGTNTTCTSCPVNRTLTAGNCPCNNGLTATSPSATCTELCGTGLLPVNTTKQCDDSNTLSGDGCSNTCTIETGFTCSNVPSVCISQTGYTVSPQSLSKDTTSNLLTAVLTIAPIPPANTVPSLANLQNSLSLQSYTLDRQTLTLHLNLLQPIDNNQQLNIALSVINQQAAFSLSSSSNLQLVPYTDSYFTLYNVESILIWVYLGLLWTLSILRIATEPQLISQVTEVFVYTSLVWIGAQGQSAPMLLFQPLLNLKYLFGYNLTLSNNSLLSVYNLGFVYILLPLLLFAVLLVISKKRPGSVPNRTKRFVLYDLTYAWLIVNSFLIAYGLSLVITSTSSTNGLTIGGIVIAAVYLLLMIIVSYRSFFRSNSFE